MSNTDATAAGPLGPVQAKLAVLQAAKGLVDADLLEELARGILEAALTECSAQAGPTPASAEALPLNPASEPTGGATSRTINAPDYLLSKGHSVREVIAGSNGFGQSAAAAYRRAHGENPPRRSYSRVTGNLVYTYSVEDLPLLDAAYQRWLSRQAA